MLPRQANVQSTVELPYWAHPFVLDGVPEVSESAIPRAIRVLASCQCGNTDPQF
jgi:hypothetical protein